MRRVYHNFFRIQALVLRAEGIQEVASGRQSDQRNEDRGKAHQIGIDVNRKHNSDENKRKEQKSVDCMERVQVFYGCPARFAKRTRKIVFGPQEQF